MKEINPFFDKNIIYEVSGYKITYGDEWSNVFDTYDEAFLYNTYKKYFPESEIERKERELREKAISRENKINQILGE
jgi:hypothetical protein